MFYFIQANFIYEYVIKVWQIFIFRNAPQKLYLKTTILGDKMIDSSNIKHLSKQEIIKNGSIFTPQYLVTLVSELLDEYIDLNSVIGDFGSGYGAFLQQFIGKGKRCFATEYDEMSYRLLKQEYPTIQIYHENSLLNISRDKYKLREEDELIIIGNPPYNDVTSLLKNSQFLPLYTQNDC